MSLAEDTRNQAPADVAASVPSLPSNGSNGRANAPRPDTAAPALKASGPLDVEDLIQFALAMHPQLQRWRADIAKSEAESKAAWDIEPAELRVGYTWDTDDSFRRPYTERSRERLNTTEQFSSTQTSRNLATLQTAPGYGVFQRDFTSGTVRESRYRDIETRVVPGLNRDVSTSKIYETRRTSESSRQHQTESGEFGIDSREAQNELTRRKLVGTERREIIHNSGEEREEELSLLLRFRLPNPMERKATLERTLAEMRLAESRYLLEAQDLALQVRELYEEVCAAESTASSHRERVKLFQQLSKDIDQLGGENAGYGSDKFESEMRALDAEGEVMEAENEADAKREELAALCGLADARRIQTRGLRTRRISQIQKLDPEWLIAMATIHRSDLLEAQARMDVALAELKEVYAIRYPMASFIDVGWAWSDSNQRIGENEEFIIRAGISLPLFDWFGWNKQHEVHKAEAASYQKQIELTRLQIEGQVKRALARIQTAEGQLGRLESQVEKMRNLAEPGRQATEMDLQIDKTPDESAPFRHKTSTLESARKMEVRRYKAANEYNKAVMQLERALGTRLEKVLVPGGQGGK